MGKIVAAVFDQTAKYLAACGRRAQKPVRTYLDVFAQVESETRGELGNDEFTRRVDQRCKALGIKS